MYPAYSHDFIFPPALAFVFSEETKPRWERPVEQGAQGLYFVKESQGTSGSFPLTLLLLLPKGVRWEEEGQSDVRRRHAHPDGQPLSSLFGFECFTSAQA